jgi:hypothetical protein
MVADFQIADQPVAQIGDRDRLGVADRGGLGLFAIDHDLQCAHAGLTSDRGMDGGQFGESGLTSGGQRRGEARVDEIEDRLD